MSFPWKIYTVNSPPHQNYCSPWQSPQQLTAWTAPAAWPAADCPCLGRPAVAGPCLGVPPAAPALLAPLPAAVPEHSQLRIYVEFHPVNLIRNEHNRTLRWLGIRGIMYFYHK